MAQSINSDIDNIIGLLNLWNIMPEGKCRKAAPGAGEGGSEWGIFIITLGLFVKETVDVMRKELAWEVNYLREAECSRKFRYWSIMVKGRCFMLFGKGWSTVYPQVSVGRWSWICSSWSSAGTDDWESINCWAYQWSPLGWVHTLLTRHKKWRKYI